MAINQIYQRIHNPEEIFGSLNKAYENLIYIIEDSLSRGKNESIIICGPSGSGKTKLITKMCHRLKNSEREANIIILEGSTHTQASAYNELLLKFKAFQQNSYMGTSQLRSISHMLQNKDSDIPLFIVLNDMDIFCSFKKQSLLYILLDCIHNKSGGIFIIGITQNPNILEMFEKRVSSRFSQRIIYTFNTDSFEDYLKNLNYILDQPDCAQWHDSLNKSMTDKVKNMFQDLYNMDNTIYKLLHIIIMLLNRINDYITESDFIDILNIACFSSRTQYLSDFSQTEVLILVAIARYCSNKDTYFFSDKIIINECYKILEDECIVFVNRDSITSAFSSLIDNHVIRPISCGQEPHCNNKYQMMYHEFEIKEMLKNNKNMSIFLSTLGKSNFIN